MVKREQWGSRIGLILAVAGNAIGLGNFLRFPVQAADHGGGAFMIPYMISLILLGIPLLWIEWALGRFGSKKGHGTAVAVFDYLWKNPVAKYIGLLGVLIPLAVVVYYTYIESWTLLYSFFSLIGKLPSTPVTENVSDYLKPFSHFLVEKTGQDASGLFLTPALETYIFFVITLLINLYILYRGVSAGIEKVAKYAMPLIFVMAIILMIRVFTLSSPDGRNFLDGLGFLWNPDFSALTNPKVWLAAAGQVFFTLSVGFGAILTYASYIKPKDDIALNGLAGASVNEFAEVILGGSIAIVASVIFFGIPATAMIASNGAFNLGFMALPAIFANIPYGEFFSFLWFLLLFFAGVTSSIALCQPAIAFLEDELGFSRQKSVLALGIFLFIAAHIPIFIKGALDEIDFWVGTFGLVVFALFEAVIFFWIYNSKEAWKELTRDNDIKIPYFFYYIMKYIAPGLLIIILISWSIEMLPSQLTKTDPGAWIGRIFIVILTIIGFLLIKAAWGNRNGRTHT
ncbi:sodium:calcium symporter [Persephonella atlantica]|uniref:Sodium:calcium symporter n=1 Tax=Persephonella atlantica TaxID=2699429 RepID=A0ABS1GEX7_9AQUI|nr:sodium-dependent transporter [Persephonella atlantica]MBK3331453.1 sodium:calcium symporter [Persephonella atlantica]